VRDKKNVFVGSLITKRLSSRPLPTVVRVHRVLRETNVSKRQVQELWYLVYCSQICFLLELPCVLCGPCERQVLLKDNSMHFSAWFFCNEISFLSNYSVVPVGSVRD